MNKVHHCLLCLGSNSNAELHLKQAETALGFPFPDIRWGKAVNTLPEGDQSKTPSYLNRIACFRTTLEANEVARICKEIERENGRTPEDKDKGLVPLDIDLLKYDNRVLKPADLSKDYVRKAMEAFPNKRKDRINRS